MEHEVTAAEKQWKVVSFFQEKRGRKRRQVVTLLCTCEMCGFKTIKIWWLKLPYITMSRLMLLILLAFSAEVYSAKRAISGRPDSKLSGAAQGKTEL